ncbi:MAG: uracil-DNA glycosylase [Chlamydiae bacterium]|nr:uracil-DNA glycosylase [Chlamydiota bacterium]
MQFFFPSDWLSLLRKEWDKPYLQDLFSFLETEKKSGFVVYPPENRIFQAFTLTPYNHVKVVILGQDPYHRQGQACGLSFSAPSGVKSPPSLKNIYKELAVDLHLPIPEFVDLTSWAEQGVLLLNTTLTVREGIPKSHYGRGWELFTDAVLQLLFEREDPIVFLLWGKIAQQKIDFLPISSHHRILICGHPSPYSAHLFLGSRHFSITNNQLISWNKKPINWII